MIAYLDGILQQVQPPKMIINVQGVGYELDISMNVLAHLPKLGERMSIHTHLLVREDAHQLYGFASLEEKNMFLQLIKVSGIGARIALAILSGLSLERLIQAIQQQDTQLLSSIPGIGAKTAQRLVLELSGLTAKMAQYAALNKARPAGASAINNHYDDALSALMSLGYSEKEAQKALGLCKGDYDLSSLIREALKHFVK